MNSRAGIYTHQPTGYSSYLPKKLPPNPPLEIDQELIMLLSEADRKLGRLDGVTQTLPNPDIFISMYVKKEALLSSQIEGTQASLIEVIEVEEKQTQDVKEVTNYVKAMHYGLERLKTFPLSLRLLREIHENLLASGRGSERSPGEFRTTQNWIGSAGCTLKDAAFVPPTVEDMKDALSDLELYFYENDGCPPLIKIALIHAQFETIHPFVDGNGRVGRLLITFWLCCQNILSHPLLYLSYYFKKNRTEYYDRLTVIRNEGRWEEWVKFFLKGIIEVAQESTESAKRINALRDELVEKLEKENINMANSRRLLDKLFLTPSCTRLKVAEMLEITPPTAGALIDKFCDIGILVDSVPMQSRNKVYRFQSYLRILEVGTE